MFDKKSQSAKKITLVGVVQGIGFRPFVFGLAKRHGIRGSVKNISGMVEIMAVGESCCLDSFVDELIGNPPPNGHIKEAKISSIATFFADDFKIQSSEVDSCGSRFFTPDLSMCSKCREEVLDNSDRRYEHFFNTCVTCGPRFSLLENFPYDRQNTSMKNFEMCYLCAEEYMNPQQRRFHAETISCKQCGPRLSYYKDGGHLMGRQAFLNAIDQLKNGEIVAIKGIGGYHLACSPHNSHTLLKLRELKGRESKPFALMFRDLDQIQKVCTMTQVERQLIQQESAPIVLLPLKTRAFPREAICDSRFCGCVLPYTPLHELIMQQIPVLVMTSANKSGSPIIKDKNQIFSVFPWSISVLSNDRPIVRAMEDSVVQVVDRKTQIIRRARGYVPKDIHIENPFNRNILALGGDLKAAFSLTNANALILSQYFGDLENISVMELYGQSIDDYIRLFNIKPSVLACDFHSGYFSVQLGEKLAKAFQVPLVKVIHHHGHVASVMAEHRLQGKVIGVAFDGSGYGEDGHIWGGEFLICQGDGCRRVAHLDYTALVGGDSAARDAEKTALCFLCKEGIETDNPKQDIIRAALSHGINTFLYSSVGRLFDAVASIMGLCHENSYQGQCGEVLQAWAMGALKSGIAPIKMSFRLYETNNMLIVGENELISLAYNHSKSRNFSPGAFALGFHVALAHAVCDVCKLLREKEGTDQVALSGGVFSNSLLLGLCVKRLEELGFSVFINRAVPPNDGGLALGQSFIVGIREHLE